MHSRKSCRPVGLLLSALLLAAAPAGRAQDKAAWWSAEVERALARAGDNRAELVKALRDTPADQRKGMAFLIAHMPDRDLKILRAAFLLENVSLAYKARAEVPWGSRIPEDIFLNDVLPYANVNEERHPWRKELYELCLPLIKGCKTPGEAAQKLNATVFAKLKVRYSTGRKKPHQSPKESIEQGVASCTGLSILLSDACRSVAVPARLAGTPLWANGRGNHTWVEIWDGDWHFTGACEPDPKGLDRGWFVGDAAQAKKDSPQHAIYAASFRKTGLAFPLVWARGNKDVPAENVTDRYTKARQPDKGLARVLIRVWAAKRKARLAVPVTVTDRANPAQVFRGQSRGEKTDANDILAFELPPGREYLVKVAGPVPIEQAFKTTAGKELLLEFEMPAQGEPPADKPGLTEEQARLIEKEARAFFAAPAAERAGWRYDKALDLLLAEHEAAVRRVVWKAYQAAPLHEALKKNYDANQVRNDKHLSAYTVKQVGKRPEKGWPLFIAMHGGGGVRKSVNDSQWDKMKRYYRDQLSVTGYLYLALRAPNDVWNGFYDEYVPPLISNLIRQFLLFGDVDPDKVFLMGYSHGGYGAFYIGPKIPDRFAAVHSSAAAPTDGAISPRNLRNSRFTFMIGEKDNAHGRRERCESFNAAVQKLKEEAPDGYPVEMEFKEGHGHGGLPDRDKIKGMYVYTRNAVPRHLTWDLTDAVVRDFFWLSVPRPGKGQAIDAKVRDNTVEIRTRNVGRFDLCLDGRLVALDRPLRVVLDGKAQVLKLRPQLLTLCELLLERGDPELAFSCRVALEVEKK
jgi:predicted esterase